MKLNKVILTIFSKNKNKTGLFLTFKNVIDYQFKLVHTWEDGCSVYWNPIFSYIICCEKKNNRIEEGYFCQKCNRLVHVCFKCMTLFDQVEFSMDFTDYLFYSEEIIDCEKTNKISDLGPSYNTYKVPYTHCLKTNGFLNSKAIFYHWKCNKCGNEVTTEPD